MESHVCRKSCACCTQVALLRVELARHADQVGAVATQVAENRREIRRIDGALRGEGCEMGLVGWISMLRQAWVALAGVAGAVLGYAVRSWLDRFPPGGSP
jgi:hypothetical protein